MLFKMKLFSLVGRIFLSQMTLYCQKYMLKLQQILLAYICKFYFYRVEKYRPKKLDDLISHTDIISTSMYGQVFND